jgi:hypothetical protein
MMCLFLAPILLRNQSHYSGYNLRRIALELCGNLKNTTVSEFSIIGRQHRYLRLTIDPQRLKAHSLSVDQIMQSLAKPMLLFPPVLSLPKTGRPLWKPAALKNTEAEAANYTCLLGLDLLQQRND